MSEDDKSSLIVLLLAPRPGSHERMTGAQTYCVGEYPKSAAAAATGHENEVNWLSRSEGQPGAWQQSRFFRGSNNSSAAIGLSESDGAALSESYPPGNAWRRSLCSEDESSDSKSGKRNFAASTAQFLNRRRADEVRRGPWSGRQLPRLRSGDARLATLMDNPHSELGFVSFERTGNGKDYEYVFKGGHKCTFPAFVRILVTNCQMRTTLTASLARGYNYMVRKAVIEFAMYLFGALGS